MQALATRAPCPAWAAEAGALLRTPQTTKARVEIGAAVDAIIDFNAALVKKSYQGNAALASTAQISMIATIVGAIAIAILLGILITNSILKAVGGEPEDIAALAARIA